VEIVINDTLFLHMLFPDRPFIMHFVLPVFQINRSMFWFSHIFSIFYTML